MNRDETVIWVRKKAGASVIKLSSEDSVKQFLKKYKKYVVGLFENYKVHFVNSAFKLLQCDCLTSIKFE
jgi:hypothetical protein